MPADPPLPPVGYSSPGALGSRRLPGARDGAVAAGAYVATMLAAVAILGLVVFVTVRFVVPWLILQLVR